MSYINVTLNHFRAIQQWAAKTGGKATLDAATFQLEVKHRNRYFLLLPQFVAMIDGRLSYVPSLVEGVFGFAGWLPYRPYKLDWAADKLRFKEKLRELGLPTPASWPSAAEAEGDFVLKRSVGSFGMQIAGPFRHAARLEASAGPAESGAGTLFAEAFVEGSILKVWFWGGKPVHSHVQGYVTVMGDGARSIDELACARTGSSRDAWPSSSEAKVASDCLQFQGLHPGHVMPNGAECWIDFRYGRSAFFSGASSRSDDAMAKLSSEITAAILDAGNRLGSAIHADLSVPVAFAVDGVSDTDGNVSWLELNTNPIVPPGTYEFLFADLFH